MLNNVLAAQMHKIITAHLSDIEKEKDAIIKSFYADSAKAGMGIETFFREYQGALAEYLESIKVKPGGSGICPPAIIGGTVEARDLEDNEIYSFHIVLPYPNKTVRDIDIASCLSPLGRAILLKTAGSKVAVQTPAGVLNYEIVNITLPGNEIKNGADEYIRESSDIA